MYHIYLEKQIKSDTLNAKFGASKFNPCVLKSALHMSQLTQYAVSVYPNHGVHPNHVLHQSHCKAESD